MLGCLENHGCTQSIMTQYVHLVAYCKQLCVVSRNSHSKPIHTTVVQSGYAIALSVTPSAIMFCLPCWVVGIIVCISMWLSISNGGI